MELEYIWAPWRGAYIEGKRPDGCILCQKPHQANDVQNLILFRGKFNYIMLNAYPYNPGHLMIPPYRHIPSIEFMTDDERNENFQLVQHSITVLRGVYNPAGFNIGINMGKVGGAGIDDHMHTHIVPRWQGDTNFMPVLSSTRVLSESLQTTYQRLAGKF